MNRSTALAYAASDQAMMAIVGACNSRVGVASSAAPAATSFIRGSAANENSDPGVVSWVK